MPQRVRCQRCRTAFVVPDDHPPTPIECPRCGARYRVPSTRETPATPSEPPAPPVSTGPPRDGTVFVPSEAAVVRSSRRRRLIATTVVAVVSVASLSVLVLWPRVRPRTSDPVERVAEDYLRALVDGDLAVQRRLGTIEEAPAIQSFREVRRDHGHDRMLRGSFAPLAALHRRIEADYAYDPDAGRFTPKHPLGAAAEALDVLEAAKEEAKNSGMYEKMASGDPDDLFDAAESYGKMFTKLAERALAPRKILPRYQALVEDAKPTIPAAQKELAMLVGEAPKAWDALLGRPFHTLKADGPFILDRAEVHAEVTDRLASLGDPPIPLRLTLIRFRLEGIDTGWRITSARRVPPEHGSGSAPSSSVETAPTLPSPPRHADNPSLR